MLRTELRGSAPAFPDWSSIRNVYWRTGKNRQHTIFVLLAILVLNRAVNRAESTRWIAARFGWVWGSGFRVKGL